MPLSRLSPRSSRTRVARQKSNTRTRVDSQRHLHLWAAIRSTREELAQWNRQAQQVDALFRQFIVPREHQLTRAVNNVTAQLIMHFSEAELDIPDKSLLGLWINENLNSLQDHPFADRDQTHTLRTQWFDLLNNDGPVENQLARLAQKHNASSNGQQHQADDDSFTEYSEPSDNDTPNQTASSDPLKHPRNGKAHQDTTEQDDNTQADSKPQDQSSEPPIEETVKTLEDKLSVERLFRQLAKVLHPDREQNEEAKAAKHILMSECLKARQEKDIQALLTLYCEHVGELPDDLNNNSHTELVNALEIQLKQLQLELRDKRFGDPLHTMIIERYSSANSADSEQRISKHANELDDEISTAEQLVVQLQEHEGLLDALDARRALEQDRMSINEMTGM